MGKSIVLFSGSGYNLIVMRAFIALYLFFAVTATPLRNVCARENPELDARELLNYREIINPNREVDGSLSLGYTDRGNLAGGRWLRVRSPYHEILPTVRPRPTNYGTSELVRLVMQSARYVAEHHPGSVMGVGNLSMIRGGRIQWSRSHQNGRDADIAFYVQHLGEPALSPGFVRFSDETLVSHTEEYSFDVERNWTLVRFLLSQDEGPVQWIFVADHIKAALLEHARNNSEDPLLLKKAGELLKQPTPGAPHDDHFHVRIFCSREDLLEGCMNEKPYPEGVQPYDKYLESRINELLKGLHDENPRVRRAVIDFLARIDGERAAPIVARMSLWDSCSQVRVAALNALGHWRRDDPTVLRAIADLILRKGTGFSVDDSAWNANELMKTIPPYKGMNAGSHESTTRDSVDCGRTPMQIRRAYAALEKISSPDMSDFLLEMLNSKRILAGGDGQNRNLREAMLAAWASRNLQDERFVEPLINLLEHPDLRTRNMAAVTLRRIAVKSFRLKWDEPMEPSERLRAANRWRMWWQKNRTTPRADRMIELLKTARPALRKYDSLDHPMALRNIVAVTRYDSYLGYNAHRFLGKLTKDTRASHDWSPLQRNQYWLLWWRSNHPVEAEMLIENMFPRGQSD